MAVALLRRLIHRKPFSFLSISSVILQNPSITSFSTIPPTSETREKERFVRSETDLRRGILRLRFPRRSAATFMDDWVGGGGKFTVSELRGVVVSLIQAERYEHALQILSWMDSYEQIHLSSSDHATKLDLIAKLQGTAQAEDYFVKLPITSKKAASFTLLHHYVKTRDLQKAETLMADLQNQAERIFKDWEFECRNYDIRVSNVLLGAYVRKGLMEKAEKFHNYTLKKGAVPNYKTYEILMEGWVKNGEMEKAVEAMKKGFSLLKYCKWRPPVVVVEKIGEYFEKKGDLVEAEKYFEVLRNLKMMSLKMYKSLVRTYINVDVMLVKNISLDMIKDGIELDEEIEELILRAKKMDFLSNG
ncbi:hypothetical protein LUZ60_000927 [Juncus effusus]|nr:hypothetical protein LUZ60_000927 [Juncus effusus]